MSGERISARRGLFAAVREARRLLRVRARSSPEVFARLYLPHYLRLAPAEFHRRLFRAMADGGGRDFAEGASPAGGTRRFAFAAPRGHAKSTVVSLCLVLWRLCAARKRCIALVSDTEAQAEMFLGDIRRELEQNAALREDWGDLVGPVWRQDQLVTSAGARVVARGAGSAVRGLRHGHSRPDLIVCDDLENDENVASAEQRRKLRQWFGATLMNLLDPSGEIWVIGTILHHDSLLANLRRGNREQGMAPWPGETWKALWREDGEERALWPEMWSVEQLRERRREIGSLAFAQEYLNEPASEADRVFRAEWLESADAWYESLPGGLEFYQAVDPAISRAESADFFCSIVVGRDPGRGDLYVADIARGRFSFDRQLAGIIEQAERWRPQLIGIESVAYQAGLADAVLARAPLPVTRLAAARDKFSRAARLAAVVENGRVKLLRGDPRMCELRDELAQFPHGAHDDQVDALGYAVALAAHPATLGVSVV